MSFCASTRGDRVRQAWPAGVGQRPAHRLTSDQASSGGEREADGENAATSAARGEQTVSA